ncbi:hypothetical protein GCG54_00001219 [Colletotrichum gloeosporioides]|uniref:Integral membrane protein n=1 Tax=Colletotrichum gloeosporioides TaxID=474922 RepID=A0A8H4C8F1_COLGL|nr:uncharacterized protein GCG54_00001219 [Colletotrichum gloeosporioides]KAF3799180.1 hypothetical protein GCG54_00001219 [Colletotrichum gloeosporioides]
MLLTTSLCLVLFLCLVILVPELVSGRSNCVTTPLGKVHALFSVKWTYLTGLIIFQVSSLVYVLPPSSIATIADRTAVAVGGAALYYRAISILELAAPTKLRPVLIFIISSKYTWHGIIGGTSFRWRVDRLSEINLENDFLGHCAP